MNRLRIFCLTALTLIIIEEAHRYLYTNQAAPFLTVIGCSFIVCFLLLAGREK